MATYCTPAHRTHHLLHQHPRLPIQPKQAIVLVLLICCSAAARMLWLIAILPSNCPSVLLPPPYLHPALGAPPHAGPMNSAPHHLVRPREDAVAASRSVLQKYLEGPDFARELSALSANTTPSRGILIVAGGRHRLTQLIVLLRVLRHELHSTRPV